MADVSMTEPGQDLSSSPSALSTDEEPRYAGYTRFELELEVQTSSSGNRPAFNGKCPASS